VGFPQLLPLTLVELARELSGIALHDARFERAALLAADLEDELAHLSGEPAPSHARRRRAPSRRAVRAKRTAERLVEFEIEVHALETTCQQLDEHASITISSRQLSDLRLGERTRRIFAEAGLLYVQDVARLPAERALEIPQLAPASVAEVRAAIMFAVETMGGIRQPMLPPANPSGDLFDGLVQAVNLLPRRERDVVVMRAAGGERVYEVDEVARVIGCPPELVLQLERHALNMLLSQPASVEACWRLEDLCARLGLDWDDETLPTIVTARYPDTQASFTNLVAWLMREKGRLTAQAGGRPFRPFRGIGHVDEQVVAGLGGQDIPEGLQILVPAPQIRDEAVRLPDSPPTDASDRHALALTGLIGAVQRLGSARISSLTAEVNRGLPRSQQLSEHAVRIWLTRHPELFTQSDPERFKLATLDVDVLLGLVSEFQPGDAASVVGIGRPPSVSAQRLHERVATEITEFLQREGPQPLRRIRSHLYGRFIGLGSADLVIAQNQQRFARDADGVISLRDSDHPLGVDIGVQSSGANGRVHFAWPEGGA
jgi:hypothetical protein